MGVDTGQKTLDHSQAVLGEKEYLKSYQKVLKVYAENLPEDMQAEYQEKANEWSDQSLPEGVQQRMAKLHSVKYIKQFSKIMWRQCGMRLIVLEAHNDTKAELCIALHDFNQELGGDVFSDIWPSWQTESIMDEWAHYAQLQISPDAQDEDMRPTTVRKKKIPVEFEDEGVRHAAYGEAVYDDTLHFIENISGGKKAAVNWTALSKNQDSMINPVYLPADFMFRETSKMRKAHYLVLLEHWYKSQEDDTVDTIFAFKGYWDSSMESVIVVDNCRPACQQQQRPHVSATSKSRHITTSKANGSQKRPGPAGIRRSNMEWPSEFENDKEGKGDRDRDREDKEDKEDKEEDEEQNQDEKINANSSHLHHWQWSKQGKVSPMKLPFTAQATSQGAPSAPRKNAIHCPAVAQKSVWQAQSDKPGTDYGASKGATLKPGQVSSSKLKYQDPIPGANQLGSAVPKRPKPQPINWGVLSNAIALPPSSTIQPIKRRQAGTWHPAKSPQFECPVT